MRERASEGTLSPLFYVFAASRQVGALLDDALAGAPLDATRYAIYSAVLEDQPVTPSELARRLGTPFTSLLDELARMRRAGHIERQRNPADGRSYLVRLSPAGLDAHAATHRLFERVDLRLRELLGADRDVVVDALAHLQAAVGRVHGELGTVRIDQTA